jgi:C4-dicarboxylate-specific signal transduction histidine kinase
MADRLLLDLERGVPLDPARLRLIRVNALEASIVARGMMAVRHTASAKRTKVYPHEILARVLGERAQDLHEAHIGVKATWDERAAVTGDPFLLDEALTRLVASAVDRLGASTPAELRLTVSSVDGWVRVTAEDDVASQRTLASVLSGARTSGLAVCQDILVQCGGRLAIATSASGGSLVTMTMPAASLGSVCVFGSPAHG